MESSPRHGDSLRGVTFTPRSDLPDGNTCGNASGRSTPLQAEGGAGADVLGWGQRGLTPGGDRGRCGSCPGVSGTGVRGAGRRAGTRFRGLIEGEVQRGLRLR